MKILNSTSSTAPSEVLNPRNIQAKQNEGVIGARALATVFIYLCIFRTCTCGPYISVFFCFQLCGALGAVQIAENPRSHTNIA
jgi:hypothetical protein